MSSYTKIKKQPSASKELRHNSHDLAENPPQLDPKLRAVKELTDRGEYARALEVLSNNTNDPEMLHCRGVCLLRLREFKQAISPLRLAALNPSTFHVHEHVANHIKINFAIALFFGGEPVGGLETLAEVKHEEKNPSVLMIHRQTNLWVKEMSLFRRLDWYLNRIAPNKGPAPPVERLGQFAWELETTQ